MTYRNKIYAIFSSLSLFLLLMLCPALAADTNINGRIFTEFGPLAKANISVYKSYVDLAENKPVYISSPSDTLGLYTFQLEPGDYYFTARGNHGSKSYFAYHGANPIRIDSENIWIAFLANEEKQPVYSDELTSLKGIVTYNGKPVQDALVAVYTLDTEKFKGLGFLAEKGIGFMKPVNKDGAFNFPLPPNKYVVIARKREGGPEIRPLKNGDLYCYAPLNPIEVKQDKAVRIEIPCYPKGDRFTFNNSPKIKSNDYLTMDKADERKKYGIKGKVTDGKGAPLKGVYVIAYLTDSTARIAGAAGSPSRIIGETQSITETDEQGNYFIRLDTDGNYGLVVRDTLGGAPKNNGISDVYNKDPNNKDPWHGISFTVGELIENVNIAIKEDLKLFE